MSTLFYLGRRIIGTLPILVLVGLITFLLIHLTPGDPAAVVAGENASAEAIAAARHRLGLDQPFLVQFWHWLAGVLHGDLGTSFTSGRPVTALIFDRLPITLSLVASVQAVAIALGIGLPLGLISGYVGGWVDTIIMRFNDALMSFPALILAVVIVGLLGPSLTNAMTAIGLVYAPRIMRVVRASTLSVRQEVYITAARATGCGDARIITRHVLPNVTGPLVVQATVLMGQALLAEAGLSFLGLGVQPPEASWGAILGTAFPYMAQSPVPTIAAGLVISVTVLCFNLIGDGIRDSVGRMRRAGD